MYLNFDKIIGKVDIHFRQFRFQRSCRQASICCTQGMRPAPTWIDRLSDEDRSFIKRFLLASGSLKAVAAEYGISYPTVRLRLDRLIEKIKVFDDSQISSEFERTLRSLYAEGKVDIETMKRLLTHHREELDAVQELNVSQGHAS
jgi:hypothetical protein